MLRISIRLPSNSGQSAHTGCRKERAPEESKFHRAAYLFTLLRHKTFFKNIGPSSWSFSSALITNERLRRLVVQLLVTKMPEREKGKGRDWQMTALLSREAGRTWRAWWLAFGWTSKVLPVSVARQISLEWQPSAQFPTSADSSEVGVRYTFMYSALHQYIPKGVLRCLGKCHN